MHGRDAVCNMMLNLIVILDLHKSKDSHLSKRKLFPPIAKLISVGPLSVVCILRVISSELDGKFLIFKSPSSLAQASVFCFFFKFSSASHCDCRIIIRVAVRRTEY